MTFKGTLLPYQPEAVDKMVGRKNQLVAYDMGLGKTVLTIAAVEDLMDRGEIVEPGLVIALSSLKYQWQKSVHHFSDSRALVIDGSPAKRAAQYDEVMDWQNTGVDYVILNYEQVVNDWDRVKELPRGFVVLDEATAIKSFRSKRSRRVKKLRDAPVRFALTGTPMENGKPEEIFSIMQFVDSKVLGDSRKFDQRYIRRNIWGGVERYMNITELHTRLQPVVVRKRQTDEDVAPYMPDSFHLDPVLVPLGSRVNKAVYKRIAKDLADDLDIAKSMGITGSAFNVMSHYGSGRPGVMDKDAGTILGRVGAKLTLLRMFCCDPLLAANSEGEYAQELVSEGVFSKPLGSPKLAVVKQRVLDHLDAAEDNKIVIFTHWVGMTDILSETFGDRAVVYTGKMNAKQKEDAKVRFQADPDVRILISSDAGGYGVDLPQANMLINYDLPDTSGLASQRNARIVRASSQWPSVTIQDFLIADSIEERMHASLSQKLGVQAAVVDGEGIDATGNVTLSLDSLSQFLKTSAL